MKNKVEWLDIVKVNGEYYLERFDVEFEEERFDDIFLGDNMISIWSNLSIIESEYGCETDCLYNCDNFFESVREKYNLTEDDDIETYMFDGLDNAPDEVFNKYDIAWCGGYINGVNI